MSPSTVHWASNACVHLPVICIGAVVCFCSVTLALVTMPVVAVPGPWVFHVSVATSAVHARVLPPHCNINRGALIRPVSPAAPPLHPLGCLHCIANGPRWKCQCDKKLGKVMRDCLLDEGSIKRVFQCAFAVT